MVGEQPWSNHPLVDLLDRTQQFIGPKGANDSSRSFAECLRGFGLGCIASQANGCCRNHSIGNWEPPPECANQCVYNFASVPGDPIIGLRSKCPRHTCWRAPQASSHLDLKLPRITFKTFAKRHFEFCKRCGFLIRNGIFLIKKPQRLQNSKCRLANVLNVKRPVRRGCLKLELPGPEKNTCIVNPKEHLSHTVDLELRYCQKLRCGHWCLIRYSHTRMFGVSTGSV